MRKPQFEALLRSASEVSGETEFIVVGSQAIHAYTDKAPVEVLVSKECDLWAKAKEEKLSCLEGVLDARSPYFTEHGVYADPVSPGLVLLPLGWEERLRAFQSGPVTAWCLEVNDLVVSKLNAGRLKDYEFINAVLRARLASFDEVVRRIETFPDLHQRSVLLARLRIASESMP
ncbi:MAG: hypothetical protein HS113_09385 [Verrucomicrobiales bacterium]|nr:hypothetical protein [Verrucomicrobiales bacterium]